VGHDTPRRVSATTMWESPRVEPSNVRWMRVSTIFLFFSKKITDAQKQGKQYSHVELKYIILSVIGLETDMTRQ
jgi:hypothetical protein